MSLALVYLARGKNNGLASVRSFFEAYRTYPPGCSHDLIVITKGWEGEGLEEVKQLALKHHAKIIELPDDGFDWGAYMRVIPLLSQDWVCFLNTHSRPLVAGWLNILKNAAETPGLNVGAVGATASYQRFIPPFPWPTFEINSIAFLLYPIKLISCMIQYLKERQEFSPFPNPHLRSNTFIIRRELFESFSKMNKIPCCKLDAWMLESGKKGFTAFLVNQGLKPIVAGANGQYYESSEWRNSGTFRVPGQPNLLVADNQTKYYELVNPRLKRKLEKSTWGKFHKKRLKTKKLSLKFLRYF